MRIDIAAVGRLRKGPEAAMVADYLDRFAKTGRSLGLPPLAATPLMMAATPILSFLLNRYWVFKAH